MASCSYIMKNKQGEEFLGFREYRKNLGYTSARDVFIKALSPDFQKDFRRYLEFDEQGVPTYDSVMRVPYIKNFLGTQTLAKAAQKNYVWIDNTREDYERLVSEAHNFNTSNPNNDSLTAIVESSDNKIRVSIVEKNEANDNLAANQYGVVKLNNKLSELFSDIGVTVGTLEQYEAGRASGMVDFSKASSMAEGFEKLIRIANNAEGVNALPEEFSHLIIGIFRDEPLVQRSLDLLESNDALVREILGDEYQAVVNSYEGNDNANSLIAEEALGRALQNHLLQASERKNTDNSSYLNKLISRLVRWIKSVFMDYDINDVVNAREQINADMQRLSNDFLSGKKKITKEDINNSKRNAVFNHLREDVDNMLQLVQNAIETERKRLKITSSREKADIDETNKRIATLNGLVNDKGKLEGVISYAKWALSDLAEANALLDNIASIEGPAKYKNFRNIQTIIQSYQEFIHDFRKTLDQYEDAQIVELNGEKIDLADLWRRVDEQFQKTQSRWNDEVVPVFVNFIAPFYNVSPLKDKNGNNIPVERLFRTATKEDILRGELYDDDVDISFGDRWGLSLGMSYSVIAQMYDQVVKETNDNVRDITISKMRDIWAIRDKAAKLGIKSFGWAFEKNRDGQKTGYYISEYNVGQFEQDYVDFMKQLHNKYGENPFGDDYIKFNQERKQWLSEHAKSSFGRLEPNDTYLNPEYSKLSKGQKEILNEFLDYKQSLEYGLSKNKVRRNLAIQRRRSGIQRTIDSAKDVGSIFQNIKEEVEQIYKRKDDDDQQFGVASGLTDFTGNEYMTLPILYTSRLKNPDELSDDLFSDLIAYTYSTTTYKEMEKIVDPLEIGKQAIKQKKLLKTKGKKVLEEEVYIDGKKTSRPVYTEASSSNLLSKIQDIMESQVYLRYLKDQGTILGVDKQKATTFFMRFTSSAYLGFNALQGIANVATAVGMQNVEAAGGRRFRVKDLAKADAIYGKLIPEFVAEIASTKKQSELALFDEMFNVRQNFKEKLRNTQLSSVLRKFFGQNWLFVQQGLGDHWIYNRNALAMSMRQKVKVDGKIMSVWDAREIITDENGYKKMRIKPGAKLVDDKGNVIGDFDSHKFGRKIARTIQDHVGAYNDEDQNAANRIAEGRLLQQMRKWIIPPMMRRFQAKKRDLTLEEDVEGFYRTFGKYMIHFIPVLSQRLQQAGYEIPSRWGEMTEAEKANCKMALAEIIQFATLWAIFIAIGGKVKDPNRSWAMKFLEYMLNREIHELGFFVPSHTMASEAVKTLQSPFVAASAAADLAKFFNVMAVPSNWTEEVESGNFKGYSRVAAAAFKLPVPPFTWYKSVNKMFDDIEVASRFYSKDFR